MVDRGRERLGVGWGLVCSPLLGRSDFGIQPREMDELSFVHSGLDRLDNVIWIGEVEFGVPAGALVYFAME